ncbi:hypothetical protein SAMN05421640_1655 [Ekhidna lutea]|uniref:Uncharacterized protein n=1 Tax=Ekhidna lutea TaxID=447679 RepID=A0A239IG61_EKHLU|nr:hypothetical protein [Ekhidna lutea]SNS92660.1 hypothetical protein SAMN05421640_1655 [Ekhidna lutea]
MNRAKQIYLAIIILCLIIIGFSTYYSLGGFDPVEVYVMEGEKERTVIGKEYIEGIRKSKLQSRVEEAKTVIDSGQLKGKLTVVYFKNDAIGADSIHYFVGASVDEIKDVLRLPAGYSYKEFTTDKVFKVFITQHWLVGPDPQEMDEIIEIKAIEEGEVLQPLSFDLYYSDGSWSTERWAR